MTDRQVTIRPASDTLANLAVVLDLVGDPTVSGGVGGWSEIPRPRRTTALEWTGTPSRTQVLPVLLDGLEAGGIGVDRSVEPQVRKIEAWSTPNAATGDEPPPLQLAGPVRTAGLWVLQDIGWGAVYRNARGDRVQAFLTLTLMEFVTPQLLRSPAKKVRRKRKGKNKPGDKGGKGGKD